MASVLNRITGADPSRIDGTLLANGRVYIVNPAGVFFGNGALVDVGQIYAAAGQIANEDFLNGIDHFTDLTGSVINDGAIIAEAVHLIGSQVFYCNKNPFSSINNKISARIIWVFAYLG